MRWLGHQTGMEAGLPLIAETRRKLVKNNTTNIYTCFFTCRVDMRALTCCLVKFASSWWMPGSR